MISLDAFQMTSLEAKQSAHPNIDFSYAQSGKANASLWLQTCIWGIIDA